MNLNKKVFATLCGAVLVFFCIWEYSNENNAWFQKVFWLKNLKLWPRNALNNKQKHDALPQELLLTNSTDFKKFKEQYNGARHKILIGIFVKNHDHRENKFRAWVPWLQETKKLQYGLNFLFVHGSNSVKRNGRHLLKVPDISKSDPNKSWTWLKESVQQYDADFVFKMDADVGVCLKSLELFLEFAIHQNSTYIGKINDYEDCGLKPTCPRPKNDKNFKKFESYMSGGFYGLKRNVIELLKPFNFSKKKGVFHEDLEIGRLVWNLGRPTLYNFYCMQLLETSCPVKHFLKKKNDGCKKEICSV